MEEEKTDACYRGHKDIGTKDVVRTHGGKGGEEWTKASLGIIKKIKPTCIFRSHVREY